MYGGIYFQHIIRLCDVTIYWTICSILLLSTFRAILCCVLFAAIPTIFCVFNVSPFLCYGTVINFIYFSFVPFLIIVLFFFLTGLALLLCLIFFINKVISTFPEAPAPTGKRINYHKAQSRHK